MKEEKKGEKKEEEEKKEEKKKKKRVLLLEEKRVMLPVGLAWRRRKDVCSWRRKTGWVAASWVVGEEGKWEEEEYVDF